MTEIKRKANAGERIKIVNANFTFGDYTNGAEMVVKHREGDRAVIVEDYGVHNGVLIIADYEYVVLEPDAPTTLLPDEALGGVLREYREVKRKAAVGERIKIVASKRSNYPVGDVGVCTRNNQFSDGSIDTTLRFEGSMSDGFINTEIAQYVVLEPTEILVISGERFRLVDRRAAVGERVIATNACALNEDNYGAGGVFDVLDVDGFGVDITDLNGEDNAIPERDYAVLEPLTSADPAPLSALPLADQYAENITVLTRKIAQLESRVETLEGAKTSETYDVGEGLRGVTTASGPIKEAVLSAQQIRDEIVERAKADVAKLADSDGHYRAPDGELSPWVCRAEFVVDQDKRKVTAVLRGVNTGRVRAVGRAKCAPGETFNAHIGRAIALRRALGLEVPAEYLTCPQPTEARAGDYVQTFGSLRFTVTGSANIVTRQLAGENAQILDDSREDGVNSAAPSALKGAA